MQINELRQTILTKHLQYKVFYCICYLKWMHAKGTDDNTGILVHKLIPLVPRITSVLFWWNVPYYMVVQNLQGQRLHHNGLKCKQNYHGISCLHVFTN